MATTTPHQRLTPAEIDAAHRLREDLLASGWTVDGVHERLGPMAATALHREQALPARRAVEGATDTIGLLTGLFTLGFPASRDAVDAALPQCGTQGLLDLGLVEADDDGLRAAYDVRPYGDGDHDWWVVSDVGELTTGQPLAPEHVLGVGSASATLASWTPRPHARRVLDLGTGCGVQALHAATHAEAVVATDISARALRLAALTAALSGQDWDLREGDLLDPVAGERFDLIVTNPPFVITPRRDDIPLFEYRDGGRAGDGVMTELIRRLPDHLEPGGIAQMIGNWEVPAGGDWRERLRGILEPTGLDAWVVQREVTDPAQYAETWSRDGGHLPGTAEHAQLYDAWLRDFAERGVEGIGFGHITLHRPATQRPAVIDLVEHTGPVASPMGHAVLAGIRARVWLAEHSEDELLDQRWKAAPDVTIERHHRPGEGDPAAILARQGGGLGATVRLTTEAAGLLDVCDGDLTADQAVRGIALVTEQGLDAVRAAVLPTLRDLVADGFVTLEV